MHVVRLLVGLTVQIDYAVLDLQSLPGQSHAALHVVLATVCGARQEHAILGRLAEKIIATSVIYRLVIPALLERRQRINILLQSALLHNQRSVAVAHLVIVLRLPLRFAHHGVSGREVEHHDVVELHMAQTLDTAVIPVRPVDV